ncbi:MAG TPA: YggS family pyridoxal phosphate-dependent enzyme [Spirochaetia bacterium]|nr:YggS family pyridoxal phosphate-dependent enzyme [Spirochaetia bacterium]
MICERLERVNERIASAAQRAGRQVSEIHLLAVTKTHPRPVVEEAIACGMTILGENRVQEADAKYAGVAGVELHLIGHLQRNKARSVPGLFSWVESIDSIATAEALSRRCADAEWPCSVLLQYNCSGEQTKSGYSDPELMLEEAIRIAALPSLELRGIMTIGPFVDDTREIARAFSVTRRLFERLQTQQPDGRIDTLSMGMTGDFETAIAEGSTEVRIGSALFGARE